MVVVTRSRSSKGASVKERSMGCYELNIYIFRVSNNEGTKADWRDK